jgi:flagellar hook protein FlgE
MLPSLNSAVSGLDAFQQQMDVIGNNIANVDTAGFKAGTVDFADQFSSVLGNAGGVNTLQAGTGVSIAAIVNNFSQGTVSNTGVPTDLAVSGNGFFVVRDSVTNAQYVTRAGDFQLDANGYLVTPNGGRVEGFSDSGLTTQGDIKIDTAGMPATSDPNATITSYTIDAQGKVNVNLSDGTSFVRGQILLQNFQSPQALVNAGNNLFTATAAAGGLTAPVAPGASGTGKVQSGALELSNVDLSGEMANLIVAQRAFEANSKVITTSDELLQVLVNMKR